MLRLEGVGRVVGGRMGQPVLPGGSGGCTGCRAVGALVRHHVDKGGDPIVHDGEI